MWFSLTVVFSIFALIHFDLLPFPMVELVRREHMEIGSSPPTEKCSTLFQTV